MSNIDYAIAKLKDAIIADYKKRPLIGNNPPEFYEKMDREFAEGLSASVGKKYIKIISNDSVWGFVVNVEDDKKFKYGDILKAAGWATPARNKARGNVFEKYSVAWTGPHYLK